MIRTTRGAGPVPAAAGDMLDRLSPDRWRRALAAAVNRRWARSRLILFALIYVAWAGLCLALWRLDYPGWRVAVLTGVLCASVLSYLHQAWIRRRSPTERDERFPFLLVVLATAVTGGIHSPMLIGIPGHLSGVLIRRGWTRETQASLVGILAAVVAMAWAPSSWVGPLIPDPTYTATVAAVLVLSVATQADYLVLLMTAAGGALRQLLQSRDARATEALARAAELERMSSHLSHELKNPLGAIKALVQLSVRAERDPDVQARLEVVQDEVARMQSILQGYLSFSRPFDALHPEAVTLGPLADEVLSILEGRAEAGRITVRRSGDAAITGDPQRLKEAILNLVANAIEATPPGGQVDIRIARAEGGVRIEFHDTGSGMSPEVLARIGTPFFTTREAGTGLGVSLARGVFVQHGGTLEYASVSGRGTVATATLPTTCKETGSDGERAAGR